MGVDLCGICNTIGANAECLHRPIQILRPLGAVQRQFFTIFRVKPRPLGRGGCQGKAAAEGGVIYLSCGTAASGYLQVFFVAAKSAA